MSSCVSAAAPVPIGLPRLQGGLRIFTEATLKDPSGKNGGTLLATAKVTLCDVGLLQRQSLGLAKTKP